MKNAIWAKAQKLIGLVLIIALFGLGGCSANGGGMTVGQLQTASVEQVRKQMVSPQVKVYADCTISAASANGVSGLDGGTFVKDGRYLPTAEIVQKLVAAGTCNADFQQMGDMNVTATASVEAKIFDAVVPFATMAYGKRVDKQIAKASADAQVKSAEACANGRCGTTIINAPTATNTNTNVSQSGADVNVTGGGGGLCAQPGQCGGL